MRGSKPGERHCGRKRGTKNKRTLARERAQAEPAVKIREALGADAFGGDAHAFLTAIYKTRRNRSDCAWMQLRRQLGTKSLGLPPSMARSKAQ
jgi:hypothetical protein